MAHNPRKRFGQNFLHDQGVIQNILSAVGVKVHDHWVEIGPGQGALTEPLLKKDIRLDVVELDRDLVAFLKNKFKQETHIQIHGGDALRFNFSELAKNGEKLRILGNLPYNISTPLLFHLLSYADCIQDMHFMLQKEVVDRICASPGSKKYGRLTVMMRYYCNAEPLFDVPPESFSPIPKVMSAIVRLVPHQKLPVQVSNFVAFSHLVTQAFSQRRKTLSNSLKKMIPKEQFVELGIDPGARSETLTLNDFVRMSNFLQDYEK